jgi:selenocysteine-specific elongation factor
MPRHTIIGTAGHIDHGKTAVIRALTGIDADRLKEEKERGITIDIGFAYWRDDVTILDVPGHEKFIRNMVAGVSTIDFFLLVIAADDGIMPQTIEHLEILNFFNIRDGIVVINKIDLVDSEWLALVRDEVILLLKKFHLENLPLIEVSAVSRKNIDQLQGLIENKIAQQERRGSTQPFRLLTDRSFVIKGFGTVVTGTVLSGNLRKGEDIQIMPSGLIKKVRGLQVHVKDTEEVSTGDRAAVNLQGISKTEVTRGDVLIRPNTLPVVKEFTGILRTVSRIPLKIPNRTKVHIYTGTAERIGQMIWFEPDKYLKEESAYHVRIKPQEALAAARNDAFLIRLHSPVITLAGGRITDINPPKIEHREKSWDEYFKTMSEQDIKKLILAVLHYEYMRPVSGTHLQQKLFVEADKLLESVNELLKEKKIKVLRIKDSDHYIDEKSFNLLTEKLITRISEYHKTNPHSGGINFPEIMNRIGKDWIAAELVEVALQKLVNQKIIKTEGQLYALMDFRISVGKDVDQIKAGLEKTFLQARFSPPTLQEIGQHLEISHPEIRSIAQLLVKEKSLIHIGKDFYLHQTAWDALLQFLRDFFKREKDLPVADLKAFIDTTRKYAIPIFEYLDAEGYTVRKGDYRIRGYRLS